MNLSIHSISFSSHSVESGLISLSIMYDNLIQAWDTHAGGRPVCPLGDINDIYSSFHRRAFVIISPLILFSASNRKYINTCFLKKCCSFLMLPQAYLQSCEAEAENMLSIWKMGTGEWLQEMFPFEGEPGWKIHLQISGVHVLGLAESGLCFSPGKWQESFVQIGSRCGTGYHRSPNFLAVCMLNFIRRPCPIFKLLLIHSKKWPNPACSLSGGRGLCLGRKDFAVLVVSLQWGKGPGAEHTGPFVLGVHSLHPQGCTTVDAHTCTWGWAEGHRVPYALWCALPGWLCCELEKMRHSPVSLRPTDL